MWFRILSFFISLCDTGHIHSNHEFVIHFKVLMVHELCKCNTIKYNRRQSFIPSIEVMFRNISHELIITQLGAEGHFNPLAIKKILWNGEMLGTIIIR